MAIRVAHKAPRSVLALLFEVCGASRSWLSALEGDLTHLAQAPCLREFAGKPLRDWFQFFRSYPLKSKHVIAKAAAATNWTTPADQAIERANVIYCLECGEPAPDRQALAVHMCRAHGIRRFIRSYVEGVDCLVCGVRFASRQRLFDHLSDKSRVCLHNYVLRYAPLPVEQVQALDLAGRCEHPRHQRLEGAHGVRYYGPYLPVRDLTGDFITGHRHPLGPNRRWTG